MVKTGGISTGYFSYLMHQVAKPLVIRFMTSLLEKKIMRIRKSKQPRRLIIMDCKSPSMPFSACVNLYNVLLVFNFLEEFLKRYCYKERY